MTVVFTDNWEDTGDDINVHVRSKQLVSALIASASAALAATQHMEVMFWRNAIVSQAPGTTGNFIRVFKGAHQVEGLVPRTIHITMSLKIQKKNGEANHNLYSGAFHLYVQIVDPALGQQVPTQLKPSELSYRQGDDIKRFPIANAATSDSDIGRNA